MVQQNGNKQHFTINSATSSNTANRTLKSIYHIFNFVWSVRPEVNLDMHPCGLDRICEHPRATKLRQRLAEWFVSPSIHRRMLYPQQSLPIVVPVGYMPYWWRAMSRRSISDRCKTGVRLPIDTNNNPRCRAQPAAITLLLKYPIYISTILLPLPTYFKKIRKEQIKMKFNIGLQQNCDQSATVCVQNGVPHEIGGSENGGLLGTWAQTVTESQPKW